MKWTKKNIQAIDRLISEIPNYLMLPNGNERKISKRLRKIIRDEFTKNRIIVSEKKLIGLDAKIWGNIHKRFSTKNGRLQSYETQRRKREIITCVSHFLSECGFDFDLPNIPLRTKYNRSLSVHVKKLGEYQLTTIRKITTYISDLIRGFVQNREMIKVFSEELPSLVAITMILSGLVDSRPIDRMKRLMWSDISDRIDLPIRLPDRARHSYIWFFPSRLARTLLEIWRFQTGNPSGSEYVFNYEYNLDRKSVYRVLRQIAAELEIPEPRISDLVEWTKLSLLSVLNNIEISVLSGSVSYRPMTSDHLARYFNQSGNPFSHFYLDMSNALSSFPASKEDYGMSAEVIEVKNMPLHIMDSIYSDWYFEFKNRFSDSLSHLFQDKYPKMSIKKLKNWIVLNRDDNGCVISNFRLMLQFLIHLVENSSLSPLSRKTYWFANWRVINRFPGYRVNEILQGDLEAFFEETRFSESTMKLSKTSWRMFLEFIQAEGLEISSINWDELTPKDPLSTVQILFPEDAKKLIFEMIKNRDPIALPGFIAMRMGLRASECVRLKVGDINLGRKPSLYVPRSKRGKSRKVNLGHLRTDELAFLKRVVAGRPRDAILCRDSENRPYTAKQLSSQTQKYIRKLNLDKSIRFSRKITFHSFRALFMMTVYEKTEDVLPVAEHAGHALTQTTVGSYLSNIDVIAAKKMVELDHPHNHPEMRIGMKTLAILMDSTDRSCKRNIEIFNKKFPSQPIKLERSYLLTDGRRPSRQGKPAIFLSYADCVRLLIWLQSKHHKNR